MKEPAKLGHPTLQVRTYHAAGRHISHTATANDDARVLRRIAIHAEKLAKALGSQQPPPPLEFHRPGAGVESRRPSNCDLGDAVLRRGVQEVFLISINLMRPAQLGASHAVASTGSGHGPDPIFFWLLEPKCTGADTESASRRIDNQ